MARYAGALFSILALLPAGASAKSPASLAASLARLRSEVEALSSKIETRKADQQARMRSLAAQKAELEIQIKREQLRLKQLAKRRSEHRAQVEKLNQRKEDLRPVVPALARILEQAIAGTLPFQLEERAKEPRELLTRFQNKMVDVDAAIAQLWEQVEDELRLGRESGIYNQTLTIDGKEHLVEVARVGMVMLFFRTRDGRHGLLRRDGDRWRTVLLKDKEEWIPVVQLFDAFKKQIRTGFFSLPNALPGGDQ